jgi:hypothetical protein
LRHALSRRAAELGITTATGRVVEFVGADDAPTGVAYEAHIAATGRVPTRLNPHDLFNALVWLAMPRTKARLNALQAKMIARDGPGPRRGALRDAATVFDENGAVLVSPSTMLPWLLQAQRWRELFIDRRDDWNAARVICFGHALMEKLAAPYKAATAHVVVLALPPRSSHTTIDAAAAQALDEDFAMSALHPLPVLGVPGWCSANADPAFYDDVAVFRPVRGAPTGRPRG